MPRLRYLHDEDGWCSEERELVVREAGRAYFVRSVSHQDYPNRARCDLGHRVWITGERNAGRRAIARAAAGPRVGEQAGLF